MPECNNRVLIEKEAYEKLKLLRLEASEKIDFVRMLTLRLFIYIDLLDNDLYDYNELLTDLRMTVTDLYNYSRDYSDVLNDYQKKGN